MRYSIIACILLFASCVSNAPTPEKDLIIEQPATDTSFVGIVSEAHNAKDFWSFENVTFDIQLFFGGTERLNAHVRLATDGTKGIYHLSDSSELAFDGRDVLISSNFKNPERARFAAYTWSYFFMFPFKMKDPGTQWSTYPNDSLNGKSYQVQRLEFDAGIGDAPDDWYIAYADKETKLLHAAAYIVTQSTSRAEAEEDPHAITYTMYETIRGIPVSTKWDFYAWRENIGLTDQLGYAEISNISFSDEPIESLGNLTKLPVDADN